MWMFLILIVLFLLYSFIKRQYTYWENSSIPHLKSKFPFGNLEKVAKNTGSFGTAIYDIYRESNEPLLGIYLFFKPAILVRDRELVKNILTKDFAHFHSRGVYVDAKRDPMSGNLFSLEGDEWKNLRQRLTPAFTSGKLKGMFENISAIGDELVKHFDKFAKEKTDIDIRDLASCYVADCLASIAFGQSGVSSIKNPQHEFRMNARRLNENSSFINIIRRTAVFVCPGLIKILRMKGLPTFMREFCLRLVKNTVEERERENIVRKDLMQYLIQLRNGNGTSDNDEWTVKKSDKNKKSLSLEEIAANVFIFYIAGNESSSSTIAYTLFEFTQNQKLLERAYEDIESSLEKHGGVMTYDAIMDMNFIDMCVKETLRKYPGLPILNRKCFQDYNTPHFTIKKGTSIIISLLGIHRDEKFFPNPEKYDPERFSDERRDYDEDMYMPFGSGPRNCIAFRMGLLITKVAIVKLLKNYRFEALSIRELEFDFGTVGLLPKSGMCKIKVLPK